MDATEILEHWPAFAGLGTEAFMSLPYWRMPIWYAGEEGCLKRRDPFADGEDLLTLEVLLNGKGHVLQIADSEAFPDLHLLWEKRGKLPREILTALGEREFGDFFQMLEKTLRCEFQVKGLGETSRAAHAFRLISSRGEIDFAIDLSPELLQVFGRRDYLDVTSEELRAQTRPARAEYGTILLTTDELAALKPGDCVLLPEEGSGSWRWMLELPKDPVLHLMASEETALSFAQLVDDDLPTVPEADTLMLVMNGKPFASASRMRLGDAAALRIL